MGKMTTQQKRKLLEGTEKVCYYCGISEEDCRDYFEKHSEFTRGRRRGLHLEVEKIDSCGDYTADNVVWACYPCNNSKSNYCNGVEEFKHIANGIRQTWIDRGYHPKKSVYSDPCENNFCAKTSSPEEKMQ